MADWNARSYHQISAPQQEWGRRVLDRVALAGDETAMDLGCGTGRLTALLAERLPRGRVVAFDRSSSMLFEAQPWLRSQAPRVIGIVMGDGASLPFLRAFDLIFSTATFHWIPDHGALFRSIITALKRGGRLEAQCGGGRNLAALRARADALAREPRFTRFFDGWSEPWHFADEESTRRRLAAAGFEDIGVSLEPSTVTFATPVEFADFIATVCIRPHLARLPFEDRAAFTNALTLRSLADPEPLTLDYWRLNIRARRPA
ncbi:MAG: methyltransferase domain-containing protein [Acidobacteria bacterium]|nr:methyltransferase domain-containing protein [Acidobacteriota bacterium]